MSFHFAVFSAERNARELQKYLSVSVKPLCLQHLHRLHILDHDSILEYTRDLAVRTAHSYAAFFDPVVQHCLDKVPRLPWAKEVSLREFQFCVQLQEVAEQYVCDKKRFFLDSDTPGRKESPEDGRSEEGSIENSLHRAGRGGGGGGSVAAAALRCVLQDRHVVPPSDVPHHHFYPFSKRKDFTPNCTPPTSSPSFSPQEASHAGDLVHTEDGTGCCSSPSASSSPPSSPPSQEDAGTHAPTLPLGRSDRDDNGAQRAAACPTSYTDGKDHYDTESLLHSSSFRCRTYASPTRDKIVSALQRGEITLATLPFETALALLRPEQSLLHILVNETRIDSLPLNVWFSHFCQRRVAWRVLHEHLLHVLQPFVFPHVVVEGVDMLDLVYHAADVVTGIHTARPITIPEESLCLSAEIQQDILHHPPALPFLCASNVSLMSPAHGRGSGGGEGGPSSAIGGRKSISSFSSNASRTPSASTYSSSSSGAGPSSLSSPLFPPSPPPSPVIYAVDSHLKYVFRELLKNAYMATSSTRPKIDVSIQAAQDSQWVTLDIIDHGHGIQEVNRDDIWRFGFTTTGGTAENAALGGFGVGLPTSKVYMDLWGGSIDIYSSVGEGTTVRVRYPKAPTEQLAPDHPEYWPSNTTGMAVSGSGEMRIPAAACATQAPATASL